MKNEILWSLLSRCHTPTQADKVEAFLEQESGFSEYGEMIICCIFFHTQVQKRDFAKAFEACKYYWEHCWRFQPFEKNCVASNIALSSLCEKIGISNPQHEGLRIPIEAFIAAEICHFGPVDGKCIRDISCDTYILQYEKCRITFYMPDLFVLVTPITDKGEEKKVETILLK